MDASTTTLPLETRSMGKAMTLGRAVMIGLSLGALIGFITELLF